VKDIWTFFYHIISVDRRDIIIHSKTAHLTKIL